MCKRKKQEWPRKVIVGLNFPLRGPLGSLSLCRETCSRCHSCIHHSARLRVHILVRAKRSSSKSDAQLGQCFKSSFRDGFPASNVPITCYNSDRKPCHALTGAPELVDPALRTVFASFFTCFNHSDCHLRPKPHPIARPCSHRPPTEGEAKRVSWPALIGEISSPSSTKTSAALALRSGRSRPDMSIGRLRQRRRKEK